MARGASGLRSASEPDLSCDFRSVAMTARCSGAVRQSPLQARAVSVVYAGGWGRWWAIEIRALSLA